MPEVQLGDRKVSIQRPTVAKAMRVITLLGLIQKQVPEVTKEYARFRKEYSEEFAEELDRAQALIQFPDRIVYGADDEPVLHDGRPVVAPSPLSRMTEADWERVGHVFRMPRYPSGQELFMHLFLFVYERAEGPVMRLMALMAMDNDKVAKYATDGTLQERLDEFAADVIQPAGLGELMELVIASFEVIEGEVLVKARSLGKRAEKTLAMFGIRTTTTPEPSLTSSEQPEQPSTDSASQSLAPSDGTPSEPSDSRGTSSSPSAASSTTSNESRTATPTSA